MKTVDRYILLSRILFHAFMDRAYDYKTFKSLKDRLAGTQLPLFRERSVMGHRKGADSGLAVKS